MNDVADFNSALVRQLADSGTIATAVLDRARLAAARDGARLDRILLRLGLLEESILIPQLCAVLNLAHITPGEGAVLDRAAAQSLTLPYLSNHVVAPLKRANGAEIVALADPANKELRDEISFFLSSKVVFAGATTHTIRAFLAQMDEAAAIAAPEHAIQADRDAQALRRADIDGPVIKFVQEKLTEAVLAGASDVHVESTETGFRLRFRINGVLLPQRVDAEVNPASVIARLKVMAQVNVAERRLPQDGRMEAMIAGRKVDFRFSSLPTQWGESIVCRILDPKALRLGWEKLGFPADIVVRVKQILDRPSGLFLVTGPTGSGKTTTLYTAVDYLNTPGRKIVTVEDPVEYNLSGIQQVQVHEEIGLTFPRVLRGVLRHDPNVIMIGEIRDEATAEIAVRAAQVGRLVLSTLHTNSAAAAVTRLVNLGVPEFLVHDVLRGVLGQELRLSSCKYCDGYGCQKCGETGLAERRLVAELVAGERELRTPNI